MPISRLRKKQPLYARKLQKRQANSCGCGETHALTCDAGASQRDPTGTLPLQRSVAAELGRRWQRFRVAVGAQLGRSDVLGLGVSSAVAAAIQPGGSKLELAQSWVDATLRQIVVGHDGGDWLVRAVERAYAAGAQRASRTTGRPVEVNQARSSTHGAAAVAELEGVAEAVSQQVVRSVARSLIRGTTPSAAARDAAGVVDRVGVARGKLLAATAVVRAYNEGSLDALEALGVARVSVVPEYKAAPPGLTSDAARSVPQPRRGSTGQFRPFARAPSASRVGEIGQAEERLSGLGMVNVLTAGDDKVCPRCEDIASSGPYTIDEARGLIPAHPSCRCAFDPVEDGGQSPEEEE